MPGGVNPPVDAADADGHPELRMTGIFAGPGRGPDVRIGALLEFATLPEACAARYVVYIDEAGRRFAGYLWRDDPPADSPQNL